jgi:pimeloyl-ACP methyl ester carboxylesterase
LTHVGHDEFFTPLGVRLRLADRRPGRLHWLFLPDGPGLGAESLLELVETTHLPGTSWFVDLPGDGSNVAAPGAPPNPYGTWPNVFLEAVAAVPHPVAVGHGVGAMFLLALPTLETSLEGLALLSSAPDAGWLTARARVRASHPLPGAIAARGRYDARPTAARLAELTIASAPWLFTVESVVAGVDLLQRLPYNADAAQWCTEGFERHFLASWWPTRLPTLILGGDRDQTVPQDLWDDAFYRGAHVRRLVITNAAHFPWMERPLAVRAALLDLARRISV